jgi:flagellar biosynthetic protein FliP
MTRFYFAALMVASVILLTVASAPVLADIPLITSGSGDDTQQYSLKLELLILLTALSFLPAFVLMTTCFARIIIVLAILRQALGLQQSPPNQILLGIAIALTLLIMRPVWTQVYEQAFVPYQNGEISLIEGIEIAESPVREFMVEHTHRKALEQMAEIADLDPAIAIEDIPFTVLLPAFALSEITTAFQIGFIIFIPFLIIDMIVASVLMSMGMMMLSPLIISLPFKLIIFVLVDGWTLIVGSITASFGGG